MSLKARLVICVLSCVSSVACASARPEPARFDVVLHAELPEGQPLAGVHFWADGRDLGTSNALGELGASLRGVEGSAASITAICPVGHRSPSTPRALALHSFASTSGKGSSKLEVTLRCEPEERLVALVVRARIAGAAVSLPVYVDGERIGLTNEQGVGHFFVRVAPNESVRVMLDTSATRQVLPTRPVRSFEARESQDILLFDQSFQLAPRAHMRTSTPRSPKSRVPYRIE